MRFSELVQYFRRLEGTSGRNALVEVLAELFARTPTEDVPPTAYLLQGRLAPYFEPVEIAPGALVNLADPPAGLTLTGDFEAGDFVEVSLGFDNGERTSIEVPVVPNSGYFEGLDGEPAPADEPSDTESATQ